jgi:hypothetical protein
VDDEKPIRAGRGYQSVFIDLEVDTVRASKQLSASVSGARPTDPAVGGTQ